ncbi:MAG: PAS domain S-box protein [Chloroflexi bacterium]|jgi:PAS domain S-box-containing protein|nr:PAS domain S-box protein [Chloroflexota bacterium]MBT3669452.1 PAS domain S-box protein [Chloroflexota bacterium]MBT4304529.1 PAS domain S-box protein [Chloroflexota bacterium]MBT4534130.1 PAS domain S-box protein [Chloroflexota bacterium]MBT4683349.1 PAS domain S-box protein [Chloroflexota bacterium]
MTIDFSKTKRRGLIYIAIFLFLILLSFSFREIDWQSTPEFHTVIEVISMISALFIGVIILIRYYSKKNASFLFLGSAFVGTFILEGYHLLFTSSYFVTNFHSVPTSISTWSWFVPRVFLSGLLLISGHPLNETVVKKVTDKLVFGFIFIATLATILFFTLAPLPKIIQPDSLIPRPREFLPGIFFLSALILYLRKGLWKVDAFEHRLVMALIISTAIHSLFMPFSKQLFDPMYNLSHLMKIASYLLILSGTMVDIFVLFRQSEQARLMSEERFQALFYAAPSSVIVFDQHKNITFTNEQAEKTFGYSKIEFYGLALQRVLQTDELLGRDLDEHSGSLTDPHEIIGCRKDGSKFSAEVYLSSNIDGEELLKTAIIIDITDRIEAEETLRENNEKLKEAQRIANLGHWELDLLKDELIWSEQIFHIFGLDPGSFEANLDAFLATIHTEDRVWVSKAFGDSVKNKTPYNIVHRITRPNGEVRIVQEQCETYYDDLGKPVRSLGTVIDITEQKQAEDEIKRTNLILREAEQLAKFGGWEIDLNTLETNFTDGTLDIYELPYEDPPLLEKGIEFYAPEARPIISEAVINAFENNIPYDLELPFITAKGKNIWIRTIGKTGPLNGKSNKLYGTIQDITERKLREEALLKTEERFQLTINNSPSIYEVYDLDGVQVSVNKAYEDLWGFPASHTVGKFNVLKSQEVVKSGLIEYIKRAYLGESVVVPEYEYDPRGETEAQGKGRIRWLSTRIYPLKDEDGKVTNIVITHEDVSERINKEKEILKFQEELISSQSRLREAQTVAKMGSWEWDRVTRKFFWSVEMCRILGYSPDNVGRSYELVRSHVHPEDIENYDYQLEQATKHHSDFSIKLRIICVDKTLKWVFIKGKFLGFKNKMPTRMIGIMQDITDQEKNKEQMDTLQTIELAATSNLELQNIFEILVAQVLSLLDVDGVVILLKDEGQNKLKFAAGGGFYSLSAVVETNMKLGKSFAGTVYNEKRTIQSKNFPPKKRFTGFRKMLREENFVSFIGLPIITKENIFGVIEVYSRSFLSPNPEWLAFLETITSQAARAIENSYLITGIKKSNEELKLAYDKTIEGWSRALEMRDYEIRGHSERVTDMTVKLAQLMGIDGIELDHIRRGALLHDIGKMAIPDKILHKPGDLDDEEWKQMKEHPVLAYKLLAPIEFLKPALDIPHRHHEKWDGSGYPEGLSGKEIPIAARIFAIIDVWDALMSNRPYRDAWPKEKVLDHLREQSGKHFDPEVVDAFFEIIM